MGITESLHTAKALLDSGKFPEAEALCREILRQNDAVHTALYFVAVAQSQLGALAEAVQSLKRAMELAPQVATYQQMYGSLLMGQDRFSDAAQLFREMIVASPDSGAAHRGLGRALMHLGEWEPAIASLWQAVQFGSPRAEALADLALIYFRQGKVQEAAQYASEAIALEPRLVQAHHVLGLAKAHQQDFHGAVGCYLQALSIQPRSADVCRNLALAYRNLGQHVDAIAALQRAMAIAPDHAAAFGIAVLLMDVGEVEQAIKAYKYSMQLQNDATVFSNLLFSLHYTSHFSRQAVFEEHRRWESVLGEVERHSSPPRRLRPGEPLRVGYVSTDLCHHPVAMFFEPLLSNHDASQVDVFVYSDERRDDEVTERLRHMSPHWRSIKGMSETAIAQQILEDRIDILVDLSGHSAQNHLAVFARKPAPVQVTYLGYPATTGLSTIDYRLTDIHADPPGSAPWYSEKLISLPHCFLCYKPPPDAPVPQRTPADGELVFGCFNRISKITDDVLSLWAQILHATANSRLVLKDKPLADPKVRSVLLARMQRLGIDPARVILEVTRPKLLDHLAMYHTIDISLDTFPYHGTTTTCEALWMGVPLLTLAGEAHISRVSVSILKTIGHSELVAHSPEEYVSHVVNLARDRPRLERYRQTLRQDMANSPLTDGAEFASAVESAYRQMFAEKTGAGKI